jgi:hypothetical protein
MMTGGEDLVSLTHATAPVTKYYFGWHARQIRHNKEKPRQAAACPAIRQQKDPPHRGLNHHGQLQNGEAPPPIDQPSALAS